MDELIFLRGMKSKKSLFGKWRIVQPVALVKGPIMGVGLVCDEFTIATGSEDKRLFASYRGMKIAEEIKEFRTPSDLEDCWIAGNKMYDSPAFERIERKIGKERLEYILNDVPENVVSIAERLFSFGIIPSHEEIKKELIDSIPNLELASKTLEEEYLKEEYGRIINQEEAYEFIEDYELGKMAEYFVKAYRLNTSEKRIWIKHRSRNGNIDEVYSIGRDKKNGAIEITLETGVLFSENIVLPERTNSLRLGFNYGGKNIYFQPKNPEKVSRNAPISEKFPLFAQKYDGIILPMGNVSNPILKVKKIKNTEKVDESIERVYNSIKNIRFIGDWFNKNPN